MRQAQVELEDAALEGRARGPYEVPVQVREVLYLLRDEVVTGRAGLQRCMVGVKTR